MKTDISNGFVFSWAENSQGKMVHVDDVPRGLACGCVCPCCHERLLARHGDVKEHGFAHHSDSRGANLKICYMVSLYKLAEQIIETRKRVHVPSYYGIFPGKDIEFVEAKTDGRFERDDKQPDVMATSRDGKKYIIEFTFDYKVQHRQAVDYKNLNCLEINLSDQTLETVERFLLEDDKDRKWLNNQELFDSIEPRYEKANLCIRVKDEDDCRKCELYGACVGVRSKNSGSLVVVENSGKRYRICKPELYEAELKARKNERRAEGAWHKDDFAYGQDASRHNGFETKNEEFVGEDEIKRLSESYRKRQAEMKKSRADEPVVPPNDRTCFMCENNLDSFNSIDGSMARCGMFERMGVPRVTPPSSAKTCRGFRKKM